MKINFNSTHLESGEEYEPRLNNADLILPKGLIFTLVIDYPVHTSAKFKIACKKPMSRADLVRVIRAKYRHVYKYENKYGVWGHYLGDLVLVNATLTKKGEMYLGVDS